MGRELTAAALAELVGAELQGDAGRMISGAAGLAAAGASQVAFFANPRYRRDLEATGAGAVLVDETTAAELKRVADFTAVCLVTEQPEVGYARALEHFHPVERPAPGVEPSAHIDPTASVDPTATVSALCYVGPGVRIGARTVLRPQVHLAAGAVVGEDCELFPHSVVGERCILGDRVVLQAGVVLGTDGFGYVLEKRPEGPRHRKVPQVGIVRIEDEVEIGAGSCVDRATTGETLIGYGCKIDNQVQIGHNCTIGPLSILCGQVGLAGSTVLGKGVVLAGGVGVAGHLTIGDGATVGAGSGVLTSVPAGETWTGYPAVKHQTFLRTSVALKRLPVLLRRLRTVERKQKK